MKNKESVLQVIKETVRKHGVLSAGLFAGNALRTNRCWKEYHFQTAARLI